MEKQKLSETDQRIESNLPLVSLIARTFTGTGISQEELIAAGSVGLVKAVDTYQPEKHTALNTYASKCIRNEMISLVRETRKENKERTRAIQNLLLNEEEEIEEPEIRLEREEEYRELYQALSSLDRKDRLMITMRFGLGSQGYGKTQKEVADYFGVSQSVFSRKEKKILNILREKIELRVKL